MPAAAHATRSDGSRPPTTPCSDPGADLQLEGLSRRYLHALLTADRTAATGMILDAAEGGWTVEQLYMQVFQPTLYEVGRLWEHNHIGVGAEHYCTAATQMIMSRLYPWVFRGERNGLKVLAASVGEELHEIGARMVCDLLETRGWDTRYLGANMPADALIDEVDREAPHVLGLSVTIENHLAELEHLIAALRGRSAMRGVRILVGGQPFAADPGLGRRLGADGAVATAAEAEQLARGWFPPPRAS